MLIKENIQLCKTEKIPILKGLNRVLASEICSPIDFPTFRASIMDGYAVHSEETPGLLTPFKPIRAGENLIELPKGYCSYITTGSAVPEDSNAVVPIEEVKIQENSIEVPLCKPNQWIREIGSDIKKGEIIGQVNDLVSPQVLALLVSVGLTEIEVFKNPIIGIVSTGNELKEIGQELGFGCIVDSNKIMLKTLVNESKLKPLDFGILSDNYELVKEKMIKMSQECDIIISSGGVSMGDHDYVKPMIEEIGQVVFGRVNMKPGKPMTFGKIGKSFIFALPGNPVSCFVCFYLFVRHAIEIFTNLPRLPVVSVELQEQQRLDPRPEYHRAVVYWNGNSFVAKSTGNQQSSRLLSAARANAILKFPQSTADNSFIKSKIPAILIGPFDYKDESFIDTTFEIKKEDLQTVDTKTPENLQEKHLAFDKNSIKCGVLTVSDRASQGIYSDQTGVTFT